MTLAEMARMDSTFITPAEVAEILGSNPQSIRLMASTVEGRAGLGFPVVRIGADTKIPRAPFLRYIGWEGQIKGADA